MEREKNCLRSLVPIGVLVPSRYKRVESEGLTGQSVKEVLNNDIPPFLEHWKINDPQRSQSTLIGMPLQLQ